MMGYAFSDIAFTTQVRDIQTLMGSREQYAHLDAPPDRGDRLGRREIAFIEAADHFYQATVSETGWPYVQHRGGPAGFLKVINDKTLGFADFVGNVQYVSVGNLKKDDRIAMIVMDYANQRRLKLLGRARTVEIDDDPELIERLRDQGYDGQAERAFVIAVEGFDWNCPQHITPRFTEAEIAAMVAPMQAQVRNLKEQLAKQVVKQVVKRQPDQLGDGPLALKITGIRQLTDRVRAYELRDVHGADLPEIRAGAHLDVPVQLSDGSLSTRCYSIASSPARRDVYEIAVLREDAGHGGSMGVHEEFRLGLVLHCSVPRNGFVLDNGPDRSVLFAGGIGITPIKAMAHELAAQGRSFELHYAVRSRSDAPFLSELAAAFAENLTVYAADEGARLDVGAIMSTAMSGTHFYVCGPERLIATVRERGLAAGVDGKCIRFEHFSNAKQSGNEQPITVTLARSGKTVHVPAGKSILDTVQAAGVRAPASCRIGNCGMCAVKVVAGTPDHRDEVLTDEQRKDENLMCICVSRATGPDLTIDL
jgi:ferredoxin-NADP reductase/predicted pyridoxine 5'-phosphate oxidase superfamily flavin-nucleotide-binding protein